LKRYVRYYFDSRSHLSLERIRQIRGRSSRLDKSWAIPQVGGLHIFTASAAWNESERRRNQNDDMVLRSLLITPSRTLESQIVSCEVYRAVESDGMNRDDTLKLGVFGEDKYLFLDRVQFVGSERITHREMQKQPAGYLAQRCTFQYLTTGNAAAQSFENQLRRSFVLL